MDKFEVKLRAIDITSNLDETPKAVQVPRYLINGAEVPFAEFKTRYEEQSGEKLPLAAYYSGEEGS